MFRGFRMRKHWRYVASGALGVDLRRTGAGRSAGPRVLGSMAPGVGHAGRTLPAARATGAPEPGKLEVADRGTMIDLTLEQKHVSGFEVVTPVGRAWTWTRKEASTARGTIMVGGRRVRVDGPALLEDNDGYHPRLTHWWWAAGAGRLTDGRTAMWNAVVGLNDTLPHIENTVWIEGYPQPIGLVTIAKDLSTVTFDDGNV